MGIVYVLTEKISEEAGTVAVFSNLETAKKCLRERKEKLIEGLLAMRERDTDEIKTHNSKDGDACLIVCREHSAEIVVEWFDIISG